MRVNKVYIEDFKNLKKFCIDIDENQMNTVLLGENATGKSNFIEALVLIFKHLDLSKDSSRKYPSFKFWIQYECNGRNIIIDYTDKSYNIHIDGEIKQPTFKFFFSKEGKRMYLPKYVFTYYSGVSNRLDEIFWDHQEIFYNKIIKSDFEIDELDDLRRLFYVKQIHSFFVLLAFFALPRIEKKSKAFLQDVLGIEDLESVLFVLKKSKWENEGGDERFWGADGLVKEFLSVLWDHSFAPIYETKKVKVDFRRKETRNRLYLFIKDKKQLKKFAKNYFDFNNEKPSNTFLFKALESTYISDMLEEVKVTVKKRKDGKVTFKELSEGEQQLLTVIGLLIFTREDESLILLDEPDTHLNPLWKYDYLHYLKTLVKSKDKLENVDSEEEIEIEDSTTQVLINTHDPLVIGSMEKSQVRMFGKVATNGAKVYDDLPKGKFEILMSKSLNKAVEPDKSPKGMGVAGILTSEMFGLPTILDKETQIKLNRKRYLQGRIMRETLNAQEYDEYHKLKAELEQHGFYEEVEDKWFKEYLSEMSKLEAFEKVDFTEDEKQLLLDQSKKAAQRVLQLMKKENEE